MMDHAAHELGMDPSVVREANLTLDGDLNILGDGIVKDATVTECWNELKALARCPNINQLSKTY